MIDRPAIALGLDQLPAPLHARVVAELEPGERLLWAGQSGSRPESAMPTALPWWIVGILSVVVVVGSIGVGLSWIRIKTPDGSAGVVGTLAGIVAYVTLALAIQATYRRRSNRGWRGRALYALTDRRAILWNPQAIEGPGAVAVISIPPSADLNISRIDYPEGTSVVCFGKRPSDWDGLDSLGPLEFVGINDARQVERLARRILRRGPSDLLVLDHPDAAMPSPFISHDLEEPR